MTLRLRCSPRVREEAAWGRKAEGGGQWAGGGLGRPWSQGELGAVRAVDRAAPALGCQRRPPSLWGEQTAERPGCRATAESDTEGGNGRARRVGGRTERKRKHA